MTVSWFRRHMAPVASVTLCVFWNAFLVSSLSRAQQGGGEACLRRPKTARFRKRVVQGGIPSVARPACGDIGAGAARDPAPQGRRGRGAARSGRGRKGARFVTLGWGRRFAASCGAPERCGDPIGNGRELFGTALDGRRRVLRYR